jgi:hypothetical protein
VCLLDLDYGLPVQVRDTALGIENDDIPESDVGKEYQLHKLEKLPEQDSSFAGQRANDTILKLARTAPYYKVCVAHSFGATDAHPPLATSTILTGTVLWCAAQPGANMLIFCAW